MAKKKDESEAIANQLGFAVKELNAVAERMRAAGYAELGESWSDLKVAKLRYQTNPVLVFGLGYDSAANDPTVQGTATMGRGVMVADAALSFYRGGDKRFALITCAVALILAFSILMSFIWG